MKTKDLKSQEWVELLEFRKYFEEYLERMTEEVSEQSVEGLIEEGLELENRIDYIQQLALKLKQGVISEQHFRDALEKPPPRNSKLELEEKASTLKESIKSRGEKDSLKYSLTQSAEMIKSKIGVKMNQLVKKRSEVPIEVSQL